VELGNDMGIHGMLPEPDMAHWNTGEHRDLSVVGQRTTSNARNASSDARKPEILRASVAVSKGSMTSHDSGPLSRRVPTKPDSVPEPGAADCPGSFIEMDGIGWGPALLGPH
jgi:hypothetical protein